jgi:hypothetical protein
MASVWPAGAPEHGTIQAVSGKQDAIEFEISNKASDRASSESVVIAGLRGCF